MRTIKFLGIAVALAAVSLSAHAQGGRRFNHFTSIDDLVRLEARQIERHQMRQTAMVRAQRMGLRRGVMRRGVMQFGEKRQAVRAQVQAGTLTREQARTQMQAWAAEHRPKK